MDTKAYGHQCDLGGGCGHKPHEDEQEAEGEGESEDGELGVVREPGRVPAVEELRDGSKNDHQQEQKGSELEESTHVLSIPRGVEWWIGGR